MNPADRDLLSQFCTDRLIEALASRDPEVPITERGSILDLHQPEHDTHIEFSARQETHVSCPCEYCNPDSVVIRTTPERGLLPMPITLYGKKGDLASLLSSAHADPDFWVEKAEQIGDATLEAAENRTNRSKCHTRQRVAQQPAPPNQFAWAQYTVTINIPATGTTGEQWIPYDPTAGSL